MSSAQGRAAAQSRKDAGTISLLLVPKLQKVTVLSISLLTGPGLSSEEGTSGTVCAWWPPALPPRPMTWEVTGHKPTPRSTHT